MARFCITYEVVTEESAEHGDMADHGFYGPGGWKYSMNNDHQRADIMANPRDYDVSLREAVESARSLGCCDLERCCPGELRASSVDPEPDYETGENRFYTVHFEASAGTIDRIARLLRG